MRVGYVLKVYPRLSETFIINEILAHQAAGLDLEIFSLRLPNDGCFHETLTHIRAPVTYLPGGQLKAENFWAVLNEGRADLPGLGAALEDALAEDAGDVCQAVFLARMARARGITHLHAHFGTVATSVARLAGRFAAVPYSFTAHAKDLYHESVRPEDLSRKLSDAAAVITVSDYNLRYLQKTFGLAGARACRVYNGVALERFVHKSPAERPPHIVAVGRLVEKKGYAVLIEACSILVRRSRDFRCSIIGPGPLDADLYNLIGRSGLTGYVTLLGPRRQSEVVSAIQGAAVLAAPCVVAADGNRDGLPTVLLEAMALGTPCVATDVTGIPEVLRDGKTGLMVPERDAPALATALERLLDDPALRVRLASEARRLIEAEFDIHTNAAAIRKVFEPAAHAVAREVQGVG